MSEMQQTIVFAVIVFVAGFCCGGLVGGWSKKIICLSIIRDGLESWSHPNYFEGVPEQDGSFSMENMKQQTIGRRSAAVIFEEKIKNA